MADGVRLGCQVLDLAPDDWTIGAGPNDVCYRIDDLAEDAEIIGPAISARVARAAEKRAVVGDLDSHDVSHRILAVKRVAVRVEIDVRSASGDGQDRRNATGVVRNRAAPPAKR